MAKGGKSKDQPQSQPSRETSNEGSSSMAKAKSSMDLIKDIAPNPMLNYPEYVKAKHNSFDQVAQDLNLVQLNQIMANLKYAQKNLTDGLADLSAFRKAVAKTLEIKRKEAAQLRKAGNPAKEVTPLEVDPVHFDSTPESTIVADEEE